MIIFDVPAESFIARVDPRLRVLTALAAVVGVCACRRPAALAAALGLAVLTVAIARVRPGQDLRRLKDLNLFMLLLAVSLPLFMPGPAALRLGPLAFSRQGLARAGLIALRANAIMVALIGLIGTMEPAHLGFALNRLGVPAKFTHVILFMVRYVEVIHREYHRLRDAMRLRAFRPRFNRHTFRTFGYLVGLLLLRSLDRSERIMEAMKCRAFRGRYYVLAPFALTAADLAFAAAAASCLIAVACMEWAWPIR